MVDLQGYFSASSPLLAQSRIFTQQGGNMTIWSSNGDSGMAVGLPPKLVTNLTPTTASTAATEAAAIAQDMHPHQDAAIPVEVTGFGGESKEPEQRIPNARTACAP